MGNKSKASKTVHRDMMIPDYTPLRLHAVTLQTAIRTKAPVGGLLRVVTPVLLFVGAIVARIPPHA